jgi:DNA-binding cell septation regulator SpoVG
MKVVFESPRGNAPQKLLANAQLIGALHPTLKITDVAVWQGECNGKGREDGVFVTMPGRQYTDKEGKKKTACFIKPVGEEWEGMNKLRDFILAEFDKWHHAEDEVAEENPFA